MATPRLTCGPDQNKTASTQVIDASGAAPRLEAMLPAGVRARQLTVRTLLAGLCLAQADHRPRTSPASTRR